jgi:hypothetical protein
MGDALRQELEKWRNRERERAEMTSRIMRDMRERRLEGEWWSWKRFWQLCLCALAFDVGFIIWRAIKESRESSR